MGEMIMVTEIASVERAILRMDANRRRWGKAFREMRRNGIKEKKAVQILKELWEAIEEGDQECTDERNMMAFMQIQESAGNPASSGDRPWVEALKLTVKAMVEDNDYRSSPMEAMRRERRLRDIGTGGSVPSACSTFRNNVRRTWFKEGNKREREDKKDYSRSGKRANRRMEMETTEDHTGGIMRRGRRRHVWHQIFRRRNVCTRRTVGRGYYRRRMNGTVRGITPWRTTVRTNKEGGTAKEALRKPIFEQGLKT